MPPCMHPWWPRYWLSMGSRKTTTREIRSVVLCHVEVADAQERLGRAFDLILRAAEHSDLLSHRVDSEHSPPGTVSRRLTRAQLLPDLQTGDGTIGRSVPFQKTPEEERDGT